MTQASGPELYAPREKRAQNKQGDGERVAYLRQQQTQANPANGTENVNTAVRRIASLSMEEIDRVMRALEGVRELMRQEGDRVSREVAGYASLSHSAVTAMRIMADSIKEWKDGPDKNRAEL